MQTIDLAEELRSNVYPGRGIVVGRTADGACAAVAYFIMGRSENSRNRIFVEEGEGIRTQAFDPKKLEDPRLIIYAPVRMLDGAHMIVTNGDQTDTAYAGMQQGKSFEQSLKERRFEPDGPNYTPRISALISIEGGEMAYTMSQLKSDDGDPSEDCRYTFDYRPAKAGEGRFISTYETDGSPLPSFSGEPKKVAIPNDIDVWTKEIWESLNLDNKVSLFVRFWNIQSGARETRIVNKHQ